LSVSLPSANTTMVKISYVSISGNISVGKTTLTSHLAGIIPACQAFIEHPGRNPYLADFYNDMPRWAFHSRVAMLAMFAARYREVDTAKEIVLMDRCIQEIIAFANLQVELGNLSASEFSVYEMLYDCLVAATPTPDIVLYLTCSPKVALQRIAERGRVFEKEISEKYLAAIELYYEQWISSLPATTTVLKYNTDSGINAESVFRDVQGCLSN
jgi:deoxyadenosine/deoxycytidine kinase